MPRQATARQLRLPNWKASATRIQRASSAATWSENESSVASAAFTAVLEEGRGVVADQPLDPEPRELSRPFETC